MATDAAPSAALGAVLLSDCRLIAVGEVIEGAAGVGIAGLAPSSAGDGADGACSIEFSMTATCDRPPSSSVIAILNEPSTMTTTLAPTSSDRILEAMVDPSLAVPPEGFLVALRPAVPPADAAAAAWAARRAAAMKLDVLTGPAGEGALGEIPLIAFSEAAMRSDGEADRPAGLVPGSSG
jgi:hypothetical protein